MAGYTHGTTTLAEENIRLRRQVHALQQENNHLRTTLARYQGKPDPNAKYTITPDQAQRLADYKAWRKQHPDPDPHGKYGGPEGLEAAAKEAALWDKRHKARNAREKRQARTQQAGGLRAA